MGQHVFRPGDYRIGTRWDASSGYCARLTTAIVQNAASYGTGAAQVREIPDSKEIGFELSVMSPGISPPLRAQETRMLLPVGLVW